jgi:hypothetical protein
MFVNMLLQIQLIITLDMFTFTAPKTTYFSAQCASKNIGELANLKDYKKASTRLVRYAIGSLRRMTLPIFLHRTTF